MFDPVSLGVIGGVSLIGGIANFLANKSATDRAEMLYDKNFQEWMKLAIPDPEQQKLAMKRFVVEGTLDPKFEQAIKAQPSEFKNIITSAEDKNAQRRALSELENVGYEGGLRLQDKQKLQESMLEGQTKDRGNRQAIAADAARRGMGGSGFEVASQLQAQQSGADRDSSNRLKIASDAQDRALQAIMGAGELGTKYRGQDFNEQAQKATAADAINRFNTSNLRDVQTRNIGAGNRAQEMNLNARQNASDMNTKQTNYADQYNKELQQRQFENQAKKLSGASGQAAGQANTAMQAGQNAGNFYSNLAGGVANTAAAYGQDKRWDKYFGNNDEEEYEMPRDLKRSLAKVR
jgi:hypothetical protein